MCYTKQTLENNLTKFLDAAVQWYSIDNKFENTDRMDIYKRVQYSRSNEKADRIVEFIYLFCRRYDLIFLRLVA